MVFWVVLSPKKKKIRGFYAFRMLEMEVRGNTNIFLYQLTKITFIFVDVVITTTS